MINRSTLLILTAITTVITAFAPSTSVSTARGTQQQLYSMALPLHDAEAGKAASWAGARWVIVICSLVQRLFWFVRLAIWCVTLLRLFSFIIVSHTSLHDDATDLEMNSSHQDTTPPPKHMGIPPPMPWIYHPKMVEEEHEHIITHHLPHIPNQNHTKHRHGMGRHILNREMMPWNGVVHVEVIMVLLVGRLLLLLLSGMSRKRKRKRDLVVNR